MTDTQKVFSKQTPQTNVHGCVSVHWTVSLSEKICWQGMQSNLAVHKKPRQELGAGSTAWQRASKKVGTGGNAHEATFALTGCREDITISQIHLCFLWESPPWPPKLSSQPRAGSREGWITGALKARAQYLPRQAGTCNSWTR